MTLPFKALSYLFRPKLLALGFFPGAITFSLAAIIVYAIWSLLLTATTMWIAVPIMMLVFLAAWLFLGNLSMVFIEDKIIDECQKIYWGELKLKSSPFQASKFFREIRYSFLLVTISCLLFVLSLIPALGILSFILLAWFTAFGFLSSLYARKTETLKGRLKYFFEDGLSNLILGMFLSFLLFVPIVNVFLLGYAQILASLLFFQREDKKKASHQRMPL